MPKVRGSIPNVINGLSQQAPSLRLTSQSSDDLNTYPLIVDGLLKRPPTRHLAKLPGAAVDSNSYVHHILRDDAEQYTVTIEDDGTVRVFDFAGVEKTVNDTSGGSYFSGVTSPKEEIKALTINDYTFIINKNKTVAVGSATAPTRDYEGIVYVRQGNYGHDYKIFIDGTEQANYQTPDGGTASHSLNIRTNYIADQLRNDLVAAGYNTSPWATTRYASTLHINNTTTDFDLMAEDSLGDTALLALKDKISDIGDLPVHCKDGFKIEISGADSEDADDYWVEFKWETTNSSRGRWSETIAPGARLGLDASTMPHVLIRESDGTFTFKEADWSNRGTGDENSVPDPSFVDDKIINLTFHRNRLGFITENNTVLSQNGDFFNFYRTSLTAALDSDPIDVAPSHTKVSLLRHAVPYQDELIVFSDQTQFRLAGNETLTPETVAIRPLTENSVNAVVDPVTAGSALYFLQEGQYYAHLYEYFYDKSTEIAEADNISSHAPNLIPAGVEFMTSANDLNLLAITTSGDPDGIYLYKYFIANREKLQSAWVRWSLPGVDRIGAIDFYRSEMFLTVLRGTEWFIEKIDCEEGQGEAVHLDRRYPFVTGVYDAGTNTTTWTAPYTVDSGLQVVTGAGGSLPLGVELSREADGTVVVKGDYSSEPIFIGWEYESLHTFSPFFQRGGQEQIAITDGRLQIGHLSIQFSNTAYFEVDVTPEGREIRNYKYSGAVAGDSDTLTGTLITNDGRFSVPILSRNDRVEITIKNDTWRPMAINSGSWRGMFNPQSREL